MELKQFAIETIDAGIYQEAKRRDVPVIQLIGDLALEQKVDHVDETYKGMSRVEVIQKRKLLRANGQPIPLHPYEKLLEFHGLHGGATVSKFFMTSAATPLFPEWIGQTIYTTALAVGDWMNYVANVERISSMSYTKLYLQDTDENRSLARRSDDAPFKRIQVKLSDANVPIKEYGLILPFDYNTLRNSPLTTLKALILDRIAIQFAVDIVDLLINVAINGDGVTSGLNTASYQVESDPLGSINNDDVVNFMTVLDAGYQIDKCFSRVAGLRKYISAIASMTNPTDQKAQVEAIGGLKYPAIKRWDTTVTSNIILGIDSSKALGLVTTDQFFMQETDQVIQRKVVDTVISAQLAALVYVREAIGSLKWSA